MATLNRDDVVVGASSQTLYDILGQNPGNRFEAEDYTAIEQRESEVVYARKGSIPHLYTFGLEDHANAFRDAGKAQTVEIDVSDLDVRPYKKLPHYLPSPYEMDTCNPEF